MPTATGTSQAKSHYAQAKVYCSCHRHLPVSPSVLSAVCLCVCLPSRRRYRPTGHNVSWTWFIFDVLKIPLTRLCIFCEIPDNVTTWTFYALRTGRLSGNPSVPIGQQFRSLIGLLSLLEKTVLNKMSSNIPQKVADPLQWRYEHHGVSNHRQLNCLLDTSFVLRPKGESEACTLQALCKSIPLVAGGSPSQKANNAEIVSMPWRHHAHVVSKALLSRDDWRVNSRGSARFL